MPEARTRASRSTNFLESFGTTLGVLRDVSKRFLAMSSEFLDNLEADSRSISEVSGL